MSKMNKSQRAYFDALERLRGGDVPITRDAVAVAAGKKPGSITTRETHKSLVEAILEAAEEQRVRLAEKAASDPKAAKIAALESARSSLKDTVEDFKLKYEAAVGREINLLRELYKTRQELAEAQEYIKSISQQAVVHLAAHRKKSDKSQNS